MNSLRLETESPEISVSVRLGLLPTTILSIAFVASFLMLSNALGKLPAEVIQVNPTPITINPSPVEVKVSVRPRVVIKRVVVPKEPTPTDAVFQHRTPIVPDSLKKTSVQIGFSGGNS
jgi:hypothetical protein